MNLIEIKNVSKRFANHLALDDVSFNIEKGSIVGLLGPNGAGKTTLIRILNQISTLDSGEIFFEGHNLREQDIVNIGYLPEERGLYKKMKIGEQALYLAQLKGLSHRQAEEKLKYWFKKFEINSWWNKKVEELSKGMQQKIQFITTIVHDPKFLIFDEPFSGFDPINANLLKEEMLQLKKNGATIILSTHNMASVEEICDNIVLLHKSKKILDGNIFDIKNKFKENCYEFIVTDLKADVYDFIPANASILANVNDKHQSTITIKLTGETSINNVISVFMDNTTIHSLKEVLPSMNDIFINQVKLFNL